MKDITKLSTALTETLTNDDVQSVAIDFSEIGFDSLLDEGFLKEIPIIGSIYSLSKATISIQDRLFTNKLLAFLKNIKEVPVGLRKKAISKIENDSTYKTKVGEKLLYIIDKCEDKEKSELIGRLFGAFLKEELNYSDFLRAAKCIELINLEDLKQFVETTWLRMDFADAGDMVGAGLMNAIFEPGEVMHNGKVDAKITCKPSEIGKRIQDLLK
jgi:hypothetical protein